MRAKRTRTAGVYAMNAPPVSLHPASNLIRQVSRPLGDISYTGRHVAAAPAPSAPGTYTCVATYLPFLYMDIHLPLAQRTCPAGARALRTTPDTHRAPAARYPAPRCPIPPPQLIFPLWADAMRCPALHPRCRPGSAACMSVFTRTSKLPPMLPPLSAFRARACEVRPWVRANLA